MPIYATLTHVSAMAAKRVFTATSIPNATQVILYLEDTQSEIDGILGADGYQVPVPTTATIALGLLRRLTTLGAWAQVEQSAQVSDDAERIIKLWEAARLELVKGTVQLVDAPRLGGENFARSQSAPTAFFTRDMAL